MNIAQIRQLDIGMKGIACSGKVTWVNEAKNIVGTSDAGNDYDFWSQFIVIKDDTDKIGVSITIESDERSVRKGEIVTIENAELQEYIKDGKSNLKLQGKVRTVAPQNAQQAPSPPAQGTNQSYNTPQGKKEPDWDAIARGKVRNSVVCAFIGAPIDAMPSIKDMEYWVNYIMTGIDPNNQPQYQANPEYVSNGQEGICPHCQKPLEDCTCGIPF